MQCFEISSHWPAGHAAVARRRARRGASSWTLPSLLARLVQSIPLLAVLLVALGVASTVVQTRRWGYALSLLSSLPRALLDVSSLLYIMALARRLSIAVCAVASVGLAAGLAACTSIAFEDASAPGAARRRRPRLLCFCRGAACLCLAGSAACVASLSAATAALSTSIVAQIAFGAARDTADGVINKANSVVASKLFADVLDASNGLLGTGIACPPSCFSFDAGSSARGSLLPHLHVCLCSTELGKIEGIFGRVSSDAAAASIAAAIAAASLACLGALVVAHTARVGALRSASTALAPMGDIPCPPVTELPTLLRSSSQTSTSHARHRSIP